MEVDMDYDQRMDNYAEFMEWRPAQRFQFVKTALTEAGVVQEHDVDPENVESLCRAFNTTGNEPLDQQAVAEVYSEPSLFDILRVLIPSRRIAVPTECFAECSDEEEELAVYTGLWIKMLEKIGIRKTPDDFTTSIDEDEEELAVSFIHKGSEHQFWYTRDSEYIDYSFFDDFDNFCIEQKIKQGFIADITNEFECSGYILPYAVITKLDPYKPVEG